MKIFTHEEFSVLITENGQRYNLSDSVSVLFEGFPFGTPTTQSQGEELHFSMFWGEVKFNLWFETSSFGMRIWYHPQGGVIPEPIMVKYPVYIRQNELDPNYGVIISHGGRWEITM